MGRRSEGEAVIFIFIKFKGILMDFIFIYFIFMDFLLATLYYYRIGKGLKSERLVLDRIEEQAFSIGRS